MKITVDTEKCTDPRECRLCLDRCPDKIFGAYPRTPRSPGVAASDWTIIPLFSSQCSGCSECVSFCPQHAITVSV